MPHQHLQAVENKIYRFVLFREALDPRPMTYMTRNLSLVTSMIQNRNCCITKSIFKNDPNFYELQHRPER